MLDGLVPFETFQNFTHFRFVFGRDNNADGPADRFARGVAKDFLGAAVPTEDLSVQGFSDDGIVTGFNDQGELRSGGFGAYSVGNVVSDGEHALMTVDH